MAGVSDGPLYRHHKGTWNAACPHSRRAGMTVVPSPPCAACVAAGEAAEILSKSECGHFEFLLYQGQRVVVCVKCWRYGKPGQNHECPSRDEDHKATPHPADEYRRLMNEVVGIQACRACKGECHVEAEGRHPCQACGGTGRSDSRTW